MSLSMNMLLKSLIPQLGEARYEPLLLLQGRSPRFNLTHIAFSSAVSFGEL